MLCARFLVQAVAWRLASCSQFIGVHLLWTHTGHVLAAAPYLILVACLLMHFFGHGHGQKHHEEASKRSKGCDRGLLGG
jgi:hypothetical protein